MVLAIDTATDAAAVALAVGGETRVRRLGWRASFTETAPAIEALLAEAGTGWGSLEAVGVPAGPGSFTGLRVGAAMALAVAEARGAALHAVPTLEAVAEAFAGPGDLAVCASLDARRGRRYAAKYERTEGGWRLVEGPVDVPPEAVEAMAGAWPVVGADRPPRSGEKAASVAEAVARLIRADPRRHRLESPERLRLVYARPGVDPPGGGRPR